MVRQELFRTQCTRCWRHASTGCRPLKSGFSRRRPWWAGSSGSRLSGEDDLDDAVRALENRGLVLARQTSSLAGQVEFAFKHALLRDVAYASLPAALRARGHAHTGAWLEDLSGDRAGELIELIAYHYADAADTRDLDLAWPGGPVRKEWGRVKAFRSLIEAGGAPGH